MLVFVTVGSTQFPGLTTAVLEPEVMEILVGLGFTHMVGGVLDRLQENYQTILISLSTLSFHSVMQMIQRCSCLLSVFSPSCYHCPTV